MASNPLPEAASKPSFAKVAAMAPPMKSKRSPNIPQKNGPVPKESNLSSAKVPISAPTGPMQSVSRPEPQSPNDIKLQILSEEIAGLSISDASRSTVGGSETPLDKPVGEKPAGTFEDDQSHLSNSSTKPTSLSMASVTTFAMDEKESLRPDDSASVQAAEEDDSVSGAASGAANSQAGSDTGMRPFRDQYREISDRIGGPSQRQTPASSSNIPRFNDGGLQISAPLPSDSAPGQSGLPVPSTFVAASPPISLEPDEKLLEAMGTPKDRLLLLQFEEKMISFIQNSKDESLDLPPCNSFGRLLAHKLADYYHLTHYVTEDNTSFASVRVFRTPFCRLPPPLSVLQNPHATNTPPPTGTAAFKIMRRGGFLQAKGSTGASTAASSSVPSKTTSEAGGDDVHRDDGAAVSSEGIPKDKATLTMEEKQAKYQAARERIFGDFQESNSVDNAGSADNSADMSRSSSSSGKKKGHKQRGAKDDSFEARSQFNVWYPGLHFQSGPPQSPFASTSANTMYPQVYAVPPAGGLPVMGYAPNGGQSFGGYDASAMNGAQSFQTGTQPQFSSHAGWQQPGQSPQQVPFSTFMPGNQQHPAMSQQSSTRSSPSMNQFAQPTNNQYQPQGSQWMPSPYAYQQLSSQRSPPPVHWPNFPQQSVIPASVPYQYGELPTQQYGAGNYSPASQHPIPGSFNRSAFNPQTRSFVPSGGSPVRHNGKLNSNPPSHASPISNATNTGPDIHGATHISNNGGSASGLQIKKPPAPSNQDSIQKKWGTPAHLPKKPPPSEVPSAFNMDNTPSLPSQQAFTNLGGNLNKGGPLIVSGSGTGLKVNGSLTAGS